MKPLSPKQKRPQAKEESLDDSVSTVKTAMSEKKKPKSALKGASSTTTKQKNQTCFNSDAQTIASQVTTISQLTEMVSAVQQENKMIMSCFDKLTEQIKVLLSQSHFTSNQSQARGHRGESGQST